MSNSSKSEKKKLLVPTEMTEAVKHSSFRKLGIWEMARRVEPISAGRYGTAVALDLVAVVHQESYFILTLKVIESTGASNLVEVFLEAVKKHGLLPKELWVREAIFFDASTQNPRFNNFPQPKFFEGGSR